MPRPTARRALAALLFAAPLAALAHTGAGHHHGFAAGFLHPLQGADHLAAMVGVGVWSAVTAQRVRDLAWAPLAFAALLLAGALAGLRGLGVPAVEPTIAASLLAIGLLVATRLRLPGPMAAAVVGMFAVFHGVAHGYELAGDDAAVATLAGMLAATVLLHAAGIAAGWALRGGRAWLPRAAGTSVAAFGAALLLGIA